MNALYAGGSDPYSAIAGQNAQLNDLELRSQGQNFNQSAAISSIVAAQQAREQEAQRQAAAMSNENAFRSQALEQDAQSKRDADKERAASLALNLSQLGKENDFRQQGLDLQKRKLDNEVKVAGAVADNAGPALAAQLAEHQQKVAALSKAQADAIKDYQGVQQLATSKGVFFDKVGNVKLPMGASHTPLTDLYGTKYKESITAYQQTKQALRQATAEMNHVQNLIAHQGFNIDPKTNKLIHVHSGRSYDVGSPGTSRVDGGSDGGDTVKVETTSPVAAIAAAGAPAGGGNNADSGSTDFEDASPIRIISSKGTPMTILPSMLDQARQVDPDLQVVE